ncbi:MAG: 16S rRNA (cytosine(1402)-N(4))-methyltransferase RsmH [bacterium]
MASGEGHRAVLVGELLQYLALKQSNKVIDATFGFGGHARAVLDCLGPAGRLFGFERDPEVYERVAQDFASEERVQIYNRSYHQLEQVVEKENIHPVDAVYFDLGICSFHLGESGRGFSFQNDEEPFDCRFDPEGVNPPAYELLNNSSAGELRRILVENAEVRRSKQIVRSLMSARPLKKAGEVKAAVEEVVYPPHRSGELARVFQAFRIEVNEEISRLEDSLHQALDVLAPGGRLAVISFHSLEDRIVKKFFRRQAQSCVCPPELPVCACDKEQVCSVVTQSPIQPKKEEIEVNSRARSAKLRVAEKIDNS